MGNPATAANVELSREFAAPLTDADVEREILAKGLTAARVTKAGIEAKIDTIQYMQVPPGNVVTICAITTKSGFTVTGESAPASPENFDKELGRKIAYDNAFRKLWPLEGYLLKETLHAAKAVLNRAPADPSDTQAALGHPAHE